MQHGHLAAPSLPVGDSNSNLNKTVTKWSSGCLVSSRGRFLFKSYQELMQNGNLIALALPVTISTPNRNY